LNNLPSKAGQSNFFFFQIMNDTRQQQLHIHMYLLCISIFSHVAPPFMSSACETILRGVPGAKRIDAAGPYWAGPYLLPARSGENQCGDIKSGSEQLLRDEDQSGSDKGRSRYD